MLSLISVPLFSSKGSLFLITWALTVSLMLSIYVCLFLFYELMIDSIFISMLLFCIFALISTLLNGFYDFNFTPIFLTIVALTIYSFCKSNIESRKIMLFLSYASTIIFSFIYLIIYRNEILSLDFSRLGSFFGDINDIAIFFGFGFTISFYLLTHRRKASCIILSVTSLFLFGLCGMTTGSKIFLLIAIVSMLACIIHRFGVQKWYLSLFTIIAIAIFTILILNLSFFSTIKHRLLSMLSTLLGQEIGGVRNTDYSSLTRFFMFLDGIEMFLRKPFFGFGIRGFYIFSSFGYGWSHNHISESLSSFGLIGTILFHLGFYLSIIGFFRKRDNNSFVSFLILLFFITSMISLALYNQKIFAFCIGIIYASLAETKVYMKIRPRTLLKVKALNP